MPNEYAPPDDVEASYRHCQRVARRAASNFYWSFWLLARNERRAMCALYAFARQADDVADGDLPVPERRAALAELRAQLQAALAHGGSGPLLPALADSVWRYKIPPRYLLEILDGVALDLDNPQFETFAELRNYCYHVASAVGLACLHIWGFRDESVLAPAIDCGIAFQLTNILRDLKEDAARGRCYLPREELADFGYTRDDLSAHVCDARFLRLMQFQTERAESFYGSGERTVNYLAPRGRRVFRMMFCTYHELLRQIQRRPLDVFGPRIRLSRATKVILAARAVLDS